MDAGRLRERLTIEAETRTANGQGGWDTGWVAVATKVPAEIIVQSGDEALRLGAERTASQYRVTVRKRAGLTAKNRLLWKGQVMAVRSVDPHPRALDTHLLLICEVGFGS